MDDTGGHDMAHSPVNADSDYDAFGDSGRGSGPGTPRWVKVSGILALIALVVLVVMLVAGGGQHGPGRHAADGGQQQAQPQARRETPSGMNGSEALSGGDTGGHTPPYGH
jgi:hypothetical protein